MAFLGGLLGGGGSDPMDIYGDLFTEKQRAALRDQQMTQGLLNAAAVFSKAGQASRLPVSIPWGEAAQALGGSGDEAMNRMLKGMQVAEEVRTSRQQREVLAKAAPYVEAIMKKFNLDRPTATHVYTQMTGAPGAPGAPTASNAPPPPPPVGSNTSDYGGTSGIPGVGGDPDLGLPPSPAKAAGLLNPGGYGGGGLPGQGVLASLGGGGAGVPLPFGQGSPGSPDLSNIKIEQLSGEALPADAPFPTLANPNKPRSAWEQGTRYDRGEVPFDPARPYATPQQFAAPPSDLDRLSQLMKVETVGKPPAASNLTGSAWEIANNNFGGMRRPGVNASPSQGGFQTFATPEAGLGAISRQLDRYASGATTGKPLSTIREIVSTWAPPSENDTETLIKRASRVMGVADNIPLNLSDPAVKAKLIEATIRNEQGGKLPVDPGLIGQVANAPPGTYTASTGSSGRGFSGRIEPLGGDAAPAGGGGPGLLGGVRPEELAALNAMLKMGGIKSDPFGSLLETYYKSPDYLRQTEQIKKDVEVGSAAALAREQRSVTEPSDIRIAQERVAAEMKKDMALQGFMVDPKEGKVVPVPGYWDIMKGREDDKQRLQQEWQAKMKISKALVLMPDGTQVEQPMTDYEIQKRLQMRGTGPPQPGDIVGTPYRSPEQTGLGTLAQEEFKGQHAAAKQAATGIAQANNVLDILKDGALVGPGSDLKIGFKRFAQLVNEAGIADLRGANDAELLANTEAFVSGMGNQMVGILKSFIPASNVDVKAAERIAGSKDMTLGGLRQIMGYIEKHGRKQIVDYNLNLDETLKRSPIPNAESLVVREPPRHGANIAVNPETGVQMWEKSPGKWVRF